MKRYRKMRILIFGGDERQIAASDILSASGHEAVITGIDAGVLAKYGASDKYTDTAAQCDAVLFPLPFSTDGVNVNCPLSTGKYNVCEVFRSLPKGTLIFCGMAGAFHKSCAEEYGHRLIDYYESEELQIKNAVPTAEGAVWTFMNNKKITVFGSDCTVAGYGKVGRALADRLQKLGSRVTVAARSQRDVASAHSCGMKSIATDEYLSLYCDADCVFNTVPCNIFGKDFVSRMSEKTIFIELASKPYGMSRETAELLGERYIAAPSLPGRTAPLSAGRIIAETIIKYL